VAKLVARLDEKKAGETVKPTVLLEGKKTEVAATLKARAPAWRRPSATLRVH
jgi:hypothetical protein